MIITSNIQYKRALARAYELMHAAPGSPEDEELDALATAIHEWEEKHYPLEWPKVKRSEILARNRRERDQQLGNTLRFDRMHRRFERRGKVRRFLWRIRGLELYNYYRPIIAAQYEKDPDTI